MLSEFEVLERLKEAGATINVDGGDLLIGPRSRVPVELLPTIRAIKPELIAYLEPSTDFGPQAYRDARILATLIDGDPAIDLDDLRGQAHAHGIEGDRFAFGLTALPERLDRAGRATG